LPLIRYADNAAMKPVLETDRLFLRELYYPATKDREETVQWVDWNVKSYGEHGYGLWAAIRKDTMSFAGQCGLVMQRDVDESDEVEIGYSFV
jgi:RimJ/RimL family protein N-acetyltransferase